MPFSEEISFSAVSDNLPVILNWIEEKSTEYLPYKSAVRLQLAAEEAVVNVVKYAYSEASPDNLIWLSIGQADNFYLEIADKGLPFNPLENINVNPCTVLKDRVPGGWGRELIIKMASAVSYKYHNNTNILRLEINPDAVAELSE